MFGFVTANRAELTEEEMKRYRAAYCGLCFAIKKGHGNLSRLMLSYDLTFLSMLLSSLYEPDEMSGQSRCLLHPGKPHDFVSTKYSEYAADMTVALGYYKCLDDWNDDKNVLGKAYSELIKGEYKKVKKKWPRQCESIETNIRLLSEAEMRKDPSPDTGANLMGDMMGNLFMVKDDIFKRELYTLGFGMGRFIYLADAAIDFEDDRKKDRYNPLNALNNPTDMKETLENVLGPASDAFERLPLVQDEKILKNIFYSGLWIKYNTKHDS
ncbi:MAG: DUF5685 family protein [Eubacteriales bacterium]|nr:DUF5685 family protein [Eubacteriales bacterium]